jgi:hypothetical protein
MARYIYKILSMFRYTLLSSISLLTVSIVFTNFLPAIANTIVPRPIYPINPINPIYPLYPVNNTYPIYYADYSDYDNFYKYKLFESKKDRPSVLDTIKNSFRALYYPFDNKIPLYASNARVYTNTS